MRWVLLLLAGCGGVAELPQSHADPDMAPLSMPVGQYDPGVQQAIGCVADPCANPDPNVPAVACPLGPDGGDTHVADWDACACRCAR